MRRLALVLVALLILAMGAVMVGWSLMARYLERPASTQTQEVSMVLEDGLKTEQLVERLHREGLIKQRAWFEFYVRHLRGPLQIHPGEYAFAPSMSPAQILQQIDKKVVVTHPVEITPGAKAIDVVDQIAGLKLGQREELLGLVGSAEFAAKLQVPSPTLEGFLYPDAYNLPRGLTAEEVLRLFVERYREKVPREVIEQGRKRLSERELVTLASIIELESRRTDERKQFAAVYLNRLAQEMPLESPAALAYGIEKSVVDLQPEDKKSDNPYNLFKKPGLPPSPIGNPSESSIRAAAAPAKTEALYAVPYGSNGQHRFCVLPACEERDAPIVPTKRRRRTR